MNKIKGIIFDLDQTLVDSSVAEPYRNRRDWKTVYSLISSFTLYDGWKTVFNEIRDHGIRCCIVTSSPSAYASKVIKHFNIPCEFVVGYHDIVKRKPNPDPMLLALKRFKFRPEAVVSLGDKVDDIISSKLANIKAVACLWGSDEKDSLIDSEPSFLVRNPIDLLELF